MIGTRSFLVFTGKRKDKRDIKTRKKRKDMLFTTFLKDNNGFMCCYRKGRRVNGEGLCAYFYPNNSPYNRLGITAGKKLGNAVTRNRIKRIIRAAYRICEQEIPMGYDIVFVGTQGIQSKTSCEAEEFIRKKLVKSIKITFEKGFWDENKRKK